MKKLVSLLCALVLLLSCAMTTVASAEAAPLVIDYYVAWPETQWNSDMLSGGVPHSIIPKYYDETHPEIEFNYIYSVDTETAQTKLNTLANTNELPDLMICEPKKMSAIFNGAPDSLLDLSEYVNADADWSAKLLPNIMSICAGPAGQVFGMPFSTEAWGPVYNMALLEKAGIESIPATYDEFVTYCDKMKEMGIIPVGVTGGDVAWQICWYFDIFFHSFGYTQYMDKLLSGEMTFSSEPICNFFDFVGSYNTNGWTNSVEGYNHERTTQEFLQGLSGCMGTCTGLGGELADSPYAEYFKVGPTFAIDNACPEEQNILCLTCGWMYSVGANVKNDPAKLEAVMNYLKWVAGEEACSVLIQRGGQFPAYDYDLTDADRNSMNIITQSWYEAAKESGYPYTWIGAGLPTLDLNYTYSECITGLIAGTTTPDEARAKMDACLAELLELVK